MLIEFIVSTIIVIGFVILSGVYYNRNKCPPGCSGPSGPSCPDTDCPKLDCNNCEIDISNLSPEQIKSIISSNVTTDQGVKLENNQCIVDVPNLSLTESQINELGICGFGTNYVNWARQCRPAYNDYGKTLCDASEDKCTLVYGLSYLAGVPTGLWRFDKTDNKLKLLPDENKEMQILNSNGDLKIEGYSTTLEYAEYGIYMLKNSTGGNIFRIYSICDDCEYDYLKEYMGTN